MVHELKVYPWYFRDVKSKLKSFEIRKNDRFYQVGDYLLLREHRDDTGYTGDEVLAKVLYVHEGEFLEKGYCVMSIKLIDTWIVPGYGGPYGS